MSDLANPARTTTRRQPAAAPARLPRASHLVTPAQLAGWSALPSTGPAHWRVFEVGHGMRCAFTARHLPGAGYIDTLEFECPPLWNKLADAALLAWLLGHGIRHDSTVVLYGRNNLAAARAAHLMLYAGVADVRLLDGGYTSWCALGLPCESGPGPLAVPAADFGVALPARPDYLLDLRDARALHASGAATLVSVRTWNEFIGERSGYSYIAARGDIPGALWGRSFVDDDINSMREFHDADGGMAEPHAIRAIWDAARIDPARPIVFYCGTGWRASLAFFYAWLMGWEQISVFDGGWCEWSRDPANPTVCRVAAPDLLTGPAR